MPNLPYPYEVNGNLFTGNGSLIPICSLSNRSLLPTLTLPTYSKFPIFIKLSRLYYNTQNTDKYILHCQPSNFTTLTKQNLSRCLSLKFLSAEMDKYVLHIAANAHACLWPKLDHWIIGLPPRRSTSFFWKRIFIPSSTLVTTTHNRVKKIMKSKFHFSILHRHHLVSRDGFWINWIIGLPPRRSTSFFFKADFLPVVYFGHHHTHNGARCLVNLHSKFSDEIFSNIVYICLNIWVCQVLPTFGYPMKLNKTTVRNFIIPPKKLADKVHS